MEGPIHPHVQRIGDDIQIVDEKAFLSDLIDNLLTIMFLTVDQIEYIQCTCHV